MYKIVDKKRLNPFVVKMKILAPLVAAKAEAGQFVILRVDENGERIPLTVAGYDRTAGTVEIIFQKVGATTLALDKKKRGESISDFVGPLGKPTDLNGIKSACVLGGGVGSAIALPIARKLRSLGAEVTAFLGFRSKELVILKDEFVKCSDFLQFLTDDGSFGRKGNVTLPLKEMLESGKTFDRVFAIGPLVMMKYSVLTAKPFGVPVTVSMNPIMIDGTGMCGGCRLSLDENGKRVTRFACVDGPDFDGYTVDFDEAISRSRAYSDFERAAHEKACNLLKKGDEK